MADIGLDASLRTDSLRLSPYVRNRLTVMRILKRFDFYEEVIS
jgi:glycerol-1-phosphate dehydrogenase [NAD(P)+]